MRITERRLRSIIRQVIRENYKYQKGVPMSIDDVDYELVTSIIDAGVHEFKDSGYDRGTINAQMHGMCLNMGLEDIEKIQYVCERVFKTIQEREEGDRILKLFR